MKSEYKKLPGKGKSLLGTSTLWVGNDHLLTAEASLATERYRRFYFKDIQAIVMRKTAWGKTLNFLYGALLFICGIILLTLGMDSIYFLFAFIVFFGILLGINLLQGPTCEVYVKTAVQTERLRALTRLKKYRKAMERIKSCIAQVQKPLTQSDILNGFCAPGQSQHQQREISLLKDNKSERGFIHIALFGVMLLSAAIMAGWFKWQHTLIPILSILVSVTGSILVILALVRQHQTDIDTPLRTFAWISVVYFGISLFLDYLLFEFSYMENTPFYDRHQAALNQSIVSFIMDNPVMVWIRGGSAVFALILGVIGLWLAISHYRNASLADLPRRGAGNRSEQSYA